MFFNMNTHLFFLNIRASNKQIIIEKLLKIRTPNFSLIQMPNKHGFWEFVLNKNMAFVLKNKFEHSYLLKNIVAFVFRKKHGHSYISFFIRSTQSNDLVVFLGSGKRSSNEAADLFFLIRLPKKTICLLYLFYIRRQFL